LLPTLIVRVDQAIKEQERTARTEGEEQRQRLRRRPYKAIFAQRPEKVKNS